MFDEQYSQGGSILHQTDPRVKLIGALGLMVTVATCQTYLTAGLGLVIAVLLLLLARLSLTRVVQRALVVNVFVLFLWVIVPVTTPGTPAWQTALFTVTHEGVRLCLLLTLKSNAILLLIFALLATSNVAALGRAMEALGLPQKLCYLLLFCYRYIFVIYQQHQRLRRAARLRCFTPSNSLHTYRTVGYLLGMTLVKSWDCAERVSQAMRMRGFKGKLPNLRRMELATSDLLFGLGLLIFTGSLLFIEWGPL